jgi:aryl-alcohol dehydrogenase-like predicted oxidoreductase
MDHRRLGRSGLSVSEIGYGNWITHGSQVAEDAAVACVRAALEAGITLFDTADVYAQGAAETVLGKALAGVPRTDYVLATKVFWPTGPGPNDRGLGRKHVISSMDASLRRLRTDFVDLYQAHRYDDSVPLEETLRAFEDLVRRGKTLYVGVSEWRADQIAAAVTMAAELGFDRIISNQPQYSLLWRVIEPEVLPASREAGIGQIVFSPVAQGVLTGKYRPGQAPPAGSRATDPTGAGFVRRWLSDEVLGRVQQLASVASSVGLSMAQLAVAWVLQNPDVSAAIIGASRPEQVHQNVKAAGVRLEPEILQRVDEVLGDAVVRDPSRTGA